MLFQFHFNVQVKLIYHLAAEKIILNGKEEKRVVEMSCQLVATETVFLSLCMLLSLGRQ